MLLNYDPFSFSSSSTDETLFLSPSDSIENSQGDEFFLQDFSFDDLLFLDDPCPYLFTLDNMPELELEVNNAEYKGELKCEEEEFSNGKKRKSNVSLEMEEISKYFYMPITRAATQLNVGLTLLKKRCRQLGICRWPYRKLSSLQTLINNVQSMKKEGGVTEEKAKEAMEKLEKEKKVVEQHPDVSLQDRTKRLRQACFKENCKRKKIIK